MVWSLHRCISLHAMHALHALHCNDVQCIAEGVGAMSATCNEPKWNELILMPDRESNQSR
jgi:hypothetical protein